MTQCPLMVYTIQTLVFAKSQSPIILCQPILGPHGRLQWSKRRDDISHYCSIPFCTVTVQGVSTFAMAVEKLYFCQSDFPAECDHKACRDKQNRNQGHRFEPGIIIAAEKPTCNNEDDQNKRKTPDISIESPNHHQIVSVPEFKFLLMQSQQHTGESSDIHTAPQTAQRKNDVCDNNCDGLHVKLEAVFRILLNAADHNKCFRFPGSH